MKNGKAPTREQKKMTNEREALTMPMTLWLR